MRRDWTFNGRLHGVLGTSDAHNAFNAPPRRYRPLSNLEPGPQALTPGKLVVVSPDVIIGALAGPDKAVARMRMHVPPPAGNPDCMEYRRTANLHGGAERFHFPWQVTGVYNLVTSTICTVIGRQSGDNTVHFVDWERDIHIHTDASKNAVGYILSQWLPDHNGKLQYRIIRMGSKQTSQAEHKFSTQKAA